MSEHGVEMNQQFMHRRDEGDLREFAGRAPAAIGGADRGVVCNGGHGRHIQVAPDIGAAALDAAIAMATATVIGQGGESDEFADLPMTERAQLRQRRQQASGGGGANAGHRLEELIAGTPHGARLDLGAQIAIGFPQLLLEPGDVGHDVLANGAARQCHPVPLSGQHVDELAASRDQGLQIGLEVIGQRPGRRLDPGPEAGEDGRVDRIGLFQQAERLRKIPNLSGIDNRDGQTGRRQGTGRADFITAGRFEDDEGRLPGAHVRDERGPAGVVIRRLPPGRGIGRPGDVQDRLGDVDAYATKVCHRTPSARSLDGTGSALRMRAHDRSTVRALTVDARTRRSGYTTVWRPRESRATASVIEWK